MVLVLLLRLDLLVEREPRLLRRLPRLRLLVLAFATLSPGLAGLSRHAESVGHRSQGVNEFFFFELLHQLTREIGVVVCSEFMSKSRSLRMGLLTEGLGE
jgi:hypothetical protein